jgi:hypothetical protein
LWFKNIGIMDKVKKINRSNTTPSSKTFRDELIGGFRKEGSSQDNIWTKQKKQESGENTLMRRFIISALLSSGR